MSVSLESGATFANLGATNNALKDQQSIITLNVMEDIIAESPWANVFEGGTVAPHEGETITTQMPGRPILNKNMTRPEFTAKTSLCNTVGSQAAFGSEQYTATLAGDRGSSPWFCIHENFHKLDRELSAHVNGLKKMLKEYMEADARNNLLTNSGHKYVANTSLGMSERITGDEYSVAVNFAGLMPNARITIREVVRVMIELQQNSRLTPFMSPSSGTNVRLVGSAELGEALRNETTNLSETTSLVEGGDSDTVAGFKKYKWKWRYRGIEFGEDNVPLRFNSVDGNGFPQFIAPYEVKIGNEGEHWVTNSEWKTAAFEVAFLVWKGTFKRLVPENFVRDTSGVVWPELAASAMAELIWSNIQDNTLNAYGDRGRFLWQILRAWQPDMPWACCPMLTKRCQPSDGLTACSSVSD